MYKVKYAIYHQDHPDEIQNFDKGELPKSFFENEDEFDTSEFYNDAAGFDLKYPYDDIECDIHYAPDGKSVTVTLECFNYQVYSNVHSTVHQ